MMKKRTKFDWEELEVLSQAERIERLRSRADELADGKMINWTAEDAPPDMMEQFWRNVVRAEEEEQGVVPKKVLPPLNFPNPAELTDEEVHRALWNAINELAERRFFLEQTDHLSDRELLEKICTEDTREWSTEVVPQNSAIHWDMLGGWSEEDIELYLRFYADDLTRSDWAWEWPDDEMPEKEEPPYQRDDRLPKPYGW
ncbi:MAG: hypothetical protein JSU96_07360 [Acidobacteriota bacterium]|nr:MAG: hypothetical protein JSU96_07360 [Acidobacteriota bacterium]